jgi:hypothetical protein
MSSYWVFGRHWDEERGRSEVPQRTLQVRHQAIHEGTFRIPAISRNRNGCESVRHVAHRLADPSSCFGNPAVYESVDPWFCGPVLRRVCHFDRPILGGVEVIRALRQRCPLVT